MDDANVTLIIIAPGNVNQVRIFTLIIIWFPTFKIYVYFFFVLLGKDIFWEHKF